ncbi:hypothetical protein CLU96_1566 [Chryseobacterium sp. 52]|nr:hypothetical protein CLU96_1566 [Chryseobacterium sp. 52]
MFNMNVKPNKFAIKIWDFGLPILLFLEYLNNFNRNFHTPKTRD